jgi:lipid II:glycine glycyltransferase (peptidoglycan interpeptide bridge formation enzyme)
MSNTHNQLPDLQKADVRRSNEYLQNLNEDLTKATKELQKAAKAWVESSAHKKIIDAWKQLDGYIKKAPTKKPGRKL